MNRLVRKYRFFDTSKDERLKTGKRLLSFTNSIKSKLEKALSKSKRGASKLEKSGKVARQKLETLVESMTTLSPQIKYWLDTGWVAKKKLVNLLMPEVCSIPRWKVGKDVDFGLKWGLTRFGGGFLLGHAGAERGNFSDKNHVEESVVAAKKLFGEVSHAYTFDRGGYSSKNVRRLSELGVREVGLAPAGAAKWEVDEKTKRRLCRRRVEVEGSIGALKRGRYSFNRPNVRNTAMMLTAGKRSILGYNLNRLLQRTAERDKLQLVGA